MTAAEKREAIRLVEESDLSVRRTLQELQIPRATFYRWYRRYAEAGMDGLRPRPSAARRYWNRVPAPIRQRVVDLALAAPERTPRELAWQFTDREGHFLSESSVYRILKAYDLIASPAFVVLSGGQGLSASNASTE
jgi:transposase-like protein